MNNQKFLQRLFLGYVRCYRTLNIYSGSTWTDITKRELDFFGKLGESLGYVSLLEYTRMDLCWQERDSRKTFLYLERETSDGRVIGEMIRKVLIPSKDGEAPEFLVTLSGWCTEATLASAKEVIRQNLGSRNLLAVFWVGPNKDYISRVEAIVYADGTSTIYYAKPELDADRYWMMRTIANPSA